MGCRAAHQTNKVVVIFGRYDVRTQISNGFRIYFGGSVKSEADRDVLVFQITINGLGAANNFTLGLLAGEVLGEQACVRIRVITTNHNETIEVEFLGIA